MHLGGLEALLKRVPNAATLREHLLASHTLPEDVGRVAAAAGVKTLVLSHFVPGDDPSITDEMWAEGVRKHYARAHRRRQGLDGDFVRDYWLSKMFFDLQQPALAAEFRQDRQAVFARYPLDERVKKALPKTMRRFSPGAPTPICCATTSSPPA